MAHKCRKISAQRLKIMCLALLIVFSFSVNSTCQVSQTAVPFVLWQPEAYGQGMGYGGSAFSLGAASSFYNPANLVTVNSLSAEISYMRVLPQLTDDLSYENIYLAGVVKKKWYLGFGVNFLDYGKKERSSETGERLNPKRVYEIALNFSGAVRLDSMVSIGATVKHIRSNLSSSAALEYISDLPNASGLAIDIGLLIHNLFPDLTYSNNKIYYPGFRENFRERNSIGVTIGLSVVNLGPEMKYSDNSFSDPLPRTFRAGFGYQAVDIEQLGLRFTIDATKLLLNMDDGFNTEWQEIDWAYGAEATFYYVLSLRAGRHLDRIDYDKFWTIGLGLGPEWLRLNYSHVLESYDRLYDRRSGEHSYSLYCNLPARFLNR